MSINTSTKLKEPRLKSYTKEELGSCPGCGHGVPVFADKTVLRIHNLEFTNKSSKYNFRLTITDENGRSVNHSPVFYFESGLKFLTESNNLAKDFDNSFDIIHTMRFLQKN
ncbi:MAG: hypothetical protein J6T60_10095 [Bacteroidales bacterium]|nr:hypothetical protein [Bacteroidales bacterium]